MLVLVIMARAEQLFSSPSQEALPAQVMAHVLFSGCPRSLVALFKDNNKKSVRIKKAPCKWPA